MMSEQRRQLRQERKARRRHETPVDDAARFGLYVEKDGLTIRRICGGGLVATINPADSNAYGFALLMSAAGQYARTCASYHHKLEVSEEALRVSEERRSDLERILSGEA